MNRLSVTGFIETELSCFNNLYELIESQGVYLSIVASKSVLGK